MKLRLTGDNISVIDGAVTKQEIIVDMEGEFVISVVHEKSDNRLLEADSLYVNISDAHHHDSGFWAKGSMTVEGFSE